MIFLSILDISKNEDVIEMKNFEWIIYLPGSPINKIIQLKNE